MTVLASAMSAGVPVRVASSMPVPEPAEDNGRFDFDTVYHRFGTYSVKFDQQVRIYGPGSIEVGMGVADLDFRSAPAVTRALHERMRHENWGYLDTAGYYMELAHVVADWNRRRHDLDIEPESIVFTSGVHFAMVAALQTFSPPGTRVLLNTPAYNGFYGDLAFTRTIPEESPMNVIDGRYHIDFEDFERRIGYDTNVFILCNPHNPTGNCWSAEELLRIGEICLKHRVIVLADEIHCDFVNRGQKYTPFASLPDRAVVNNSITFKAASKSFGLAALKTAWFFSTNRELLDRVRKNHRPEISTLGLVASRGALEGGEDWLDQLIDYVDGNHDFAVRYIEKHIPMIRAHKPQGTFLLWLDVASLAERVDASKLAEVENSKKPAAAATVTPEKAMETWFVRNARVQLYAGSAFGSGGAGHMRMNLATSRKLIELAVGNIANACRSIDRSP